MAHETPEAASLASPTAHGQTARLVQLDGAVVARVMAAALPYALRAAWGPRVQKVQPERIERYLQADASPVGLALAARNEALPAELREIARLRLGRLGVAPAQVQRLERHFVALVRRSRAKLLAHLSIAQGAQPDLDRLDLLAEVVAVRDAQADVQSERSLVRTFRAQFRTREPFVVWILVALGLALFIVLRKADAATAQPALQAMVLEPSLGRPWTLLSYALVHRLDDWGHVALNMLALALVGPILEQILGHLRFLAAYLGLAVGAGLVSVLFRAAFDVPFATLGASGAIAGLAGLALFLGLWFQGRYGRIPVRYTASTLLGGAVLVSNFLLAATSGDVAIDHGAHLGGLALGLALGAQLRRTLAARADACFGR